jgi:hypothetical protein
MATFSDGDRAYVCDACAMHLQQTAEDHHTRIQLDRLLDWRPQ